VDNNIEKIEYLKKLNEMVRKPNHFVKKGKPNSSLGGHFASKYAKKIPLYQYIKISTIDKLIDLYKNNDEIGVSMITEHDANVRTLFNRLKDISNKNVLLLDIDKVVKINKDNIINKLILSTRSMLSIDSTKNMLTYSFNDGINLQKSNGVDHEKHIKNIREMLSKTSNKQEDSNKSSFKRT
jgi:hypothetical protein